MSSHPRIPMRIAGGRPIPGSARSHSSSACGSRNLPRLRSPSPEVNAVAPFGQLVEGNHPFTFGGGEVPVLRDIPRSNHIQFGIMDAPTPGPSGASPAPTSPRPVTREQLYGALTISHRGSVAFQPTHRFNDWLSGLDFPSNPVTTCDSSFPAPAPAREAIDRMIDGVSRNDDKTEKVAGGIKRRTLDLTEEPQPPTKRGRLSASIQRRFSRASENGRPAATVAAVNQEANDPMCEINSRLSFFSLGGGIPGVNPDRSINIAFVGDVGCGKTAFLNYLTMGNLAVTRPGEPTRIANHRDYTMVDQGEVINLRLWDLPGTIGREHLLVDNFQAAVICFSIGDEQSWRRVAEYWYPVLTSSLAVEAHPIYVVGLKKDLRPTTPSFLQLPSFFEQQPKAVTWREGAIATKMVNGVGYSECSTKEHNGNIPRVMNTIFRMTINHIRGREEKMRKAKRKEQGKQKIEDTKAAIKKTGKAIHNFVTCGVRKMSGHGNDSEDAAQP